MDSDRVGQPFGVFIPVIVTADRRGWAPRVDPGLMIVAADSFRVGERLLWSAWWADHTLTADGRRTSWLRNQVSSLRAVRRSPIRRLHHLRSFYE